MSSLASRAAALKARTVEVSFKDTDAPDTSGDILTTFESNSGVKSETANEWIINVFPDFMVIITYIMLIVRRFSLANDARIHPKISTPTVCMYYVAVLYGYFLASDCYLRPTPSAYARLWKESSWRHEFLEFLMTLPVPEDLEPIIRQFSPTETERSKNIFWIPCAAAFQLKHFFGRFLPLNFFSVLHDAASSLPGNSNKVTVMAHILSQPLIHHTFNAAHRTTYHLASFLGYSLEQGTPTTANYINSKFHQVFTTVFNPVLFRDYQRRSSLAEIGLSSPSFSAQEPNAYDILFSATGPNLAELRVVLQTVSSFLKGNVKCTKTLGQLLSETSGNEITAHGYSDYHLPVMSCNAAANDFSAITRLTRVEFVARAQDISFLDVAAARPTPATQITDGRYQQADTTNANVPANHMITHNWPWSFFSAPARDANTVSFPRFTRDHADTVLFDENTHVTPRVLLLDINNDLKSASAVALLCGKIIYSFELDGTTIEHPNVNKALGMQNVLFADSAIPFERVIYASKFYPRTQGSVLPPLRRATANSTRSLPASSLLHDRTKIWLPQIDAANWTAGTQSTTIIDAAEPHTLPGMTRLPHSDWIRYAQSFLGFRTTKPTDAAQTASAIPGMENGRLLLWSPYTYITYEDSDDVTVNYAATHRYFLTNLRSLFGTDYNLVEMKHPFEALPVS